MLKPSLSRFSKEKARQIPEIFRICNTICQQICINSLYSKSYCKDKRMWSLIAIGHTVKLGRIKKYQYEKSLSMLLDNIA